MIINNFRLFEINNNNEKYSKLNENYLNEFLELEQKIQKCTKCELAISSKKKVIMEGSYTPKILFIGEAPGSKENISGIPFSGASGKILRSMIENVGIKKEDYAIVNILKCHPPKNRRPYRNEINSCLHFLIGQLFLFDPKIVVLLGNTAEVVFRNKLYKKKIGWGE